MDAVGSHEANAENEANGANGANGTNGTNKVDSNGASEKAKPAAPPSFPVGSGGPTRKEKPASRPAATRQGVSKAFSQFGQLIRAYERPTPSQGGAGTFTAASDPKRPGFRDDLKHIGLKEVKVVVKMLKGKLKGQPMDDKTMLMEQVIQLVAGLPSNSKLREELTNNFLNELWGSLDHPPLLYIGDKFQYRMADGSWNNPLMPQLGAAGSAYARTCRPGVVPLGALPDPGLIFDTIMSRTNYRKHPNNVSSILWYWATIIIHDLFWTDFTDITKNKTSSYLDLSPLYGSNQEMQDTIRTFKDGLMKPDTYADKRLQGMPPGVSVLLIMFNRFHNHVATNLALINEGGRFTKPSPSLEGEKAAAAWKKYDNDLFQTARLVTSGLYINITLVDYVRNIVNLNRSNTTWTLDPRQEMGRDAGTAKGADRGTGSIVSAEFNLCYRWHSCISAKDEVWVQEMYRELFGKDPLEVTIQDMVSGFMKFEKMIPDDPAQRTFGGFERGADGRFNDDDLVECITAAIEDCAGSFGGRNVPKAMKPVEILGILQGRKWNVAGLNEFRKHFGLKPYEKFEDINSDPEIANSLRHLYEHPDFVELYPGLVAEEAKEPMVPGVGIAPTYTISRVVLSDAVCLTRGDRYYTIDYHPRNLTSWGYNEVSYDMNVNQGCVFYKLFLRAFPNHFTNNSVYAHYPMVVPSETKKILTDLGRVKQFDFERPSFIPQHVEVKSFSGAKYVLENQDKFKSTWHETLSFLMGDGGSRSLLSGDPKVHASQRKALHEQLYNDNWHIRIKTFFQQTMERLLNQHAYQLGGAKYVDIVRNVGNIAPVHFASRMFNLPLKTTENSKGIYTEIELYQVLALISACISHDIDPTKSFPLRQAAKGVTAQLGKFLEDSVKSATGFGGLFASKPRKDDPLGTYGIDLMKGLHKSGMSAQDIAWSQLLPTAVETVPNLGEAFAQAVDFYLSPAGESHLPELNRLANRPASEETDSVLLGYCLEGIRLAGNFSSHKQAAADDVIVEEGGHEIHVKAQDKILVSFAAASRDESRFPNPEEVNARRPLNAYINFGFGPQACLGSDIAQVALTEMCRSLFKRKNLRRAAGAQGELKKIQRPGGMYAYMRDDRGSYWPFPCTMKICYDE
ncbi:linoleate diol synthase [Xylariales sp. PMI_506]|nr:linoleate diol synthase [Xylariales sp. PMI_506]